MFEKLKRFSTSWTATFIYVFLFMSFAFQAFKIPSESMENTLLIGDNLFVKKFKYGIVTPYVPFLNINIIPGTDGHLVDWGTPERGDIVVFRLPEKEHVMYVKRLIGLPGDEFFMKDKVLYAKFHEGREWSLNNFPKEKIVEFYGDTWVKNPFFGKYPGIHNDSNVTVAPTVEEEGIFNFGLIKVPAGEYFMLGDNRDHSYDSRFWGCVPYGNFVGEPGIIFYSSGEDKIRFDRMLSIPD